MGSQQDAPASGIGKHIRHRERLESAGAPGCSHGAPSTHHGDQPSRFPDHRTHHAPRIFGRDLSRWLTTARRQFILGWSALPAVGRQTPGRGDLRQRVSMGCSPVRFFHTIFPMMAETLQRAARACRWLAPRRRAHLRIARSHAAVSSPGRMGHQIGRGESGG